MTVHRMTPEELGGLAADLAEVVLATVAARRGACVGEAAIEP